MHCNSPCPFHNFVANNFFTRWWKKYDSKFNEIVMWFVQPWYWSPFIKIASTSVQSYCHCSCFNDLITRRNNAASYLLLFVVHASLIMLNFYWSEINTIKVWSKLFNKHCCDWSMNKLLKNIWIFGLPYIDDVKLHTSYKNISCVLNTLIKPKIRFETCRWQYFKSKDIIELKAD